MRYSFSEKGAALVVVMAIVVISTALIAVVFHVMQRGTETSGLEQKYETAKDASLGAIDVFAKEIIPLAIVFAKATPNSSLTSTIAQFTSITSASMAAGATDSCFSDKLLKSTSSWGTGCADTVKDIAFTLSSTGGQPFDVQTKIVDTVAGNSDTSGLTLEGTGVAESMGAVVAIQHLPYMYSMDVQGERRNNSGEKAGFEVLYAY